MRKRFPQTLIALAVLVALLAPPLPSVRAQSGTCPGMALTSLVPMAYEAITVSSTAIGFTAATIAASGNTPGASYAVVYVATDAIRYRDDGSNPTASVGMPVAAATSFQVCGRKAVNQIKFIRQTTDATLHVSLYRGE